MGTPAGWARPTASQIVARLRERPPFDRMEPDDLAWLVERLEVRRWPDGAVLLQPGREAQAFFVIYDGQAQMEAMGEVSEERRILAELGPGDCFPVEALEERRPVFSTIRARSALTCLQLSLADFRWLRRRSDRFREFSTHRATAFLEESRRIFHAHFAQRGGEPPPLSTPLSVLMRTHPLACTRATPLREALRRVDEEGADVIVVVDEGERPRGLLDLPAILRRVTLPALDLSAPIERVMLTEFVRLPPRAFGFEAALEMASTGARQVLVKTIADETDLRFREWIEARRTRVDEASGGRIGYLYVQSTGVDAQNELVRQFMAQWRKDGLVIDERFNSGGQIPDRFIELLNRPMLAYWAVRYGEDWQWPPVAHRGPKVMLINGWSGSGGDAFPFYFREAKLGPLVGQRTWGGLIGISGSPSLVDGGAVTVPTFRMYDVRGQWFAEGHGVEPDIRVEEDPSQLAKGTDTQLERAIVEVLRLAKEKPPAPPARPAYEKRVPAK